MIFRSLALLGIGAMLALGGPSIAAAQSGATEPTAVNSQKLVKPKPKPKKTAAKTSVKSKTTASARMKKKPLVKPVEEVSQKRGGLFAGLFKPNEKPTAGSPVKTTKAVVKTDPRMLAKKPLPPLAALTPLALPTPQQQLALSPTGNEGELRSEQTMPRSGFFAALFGDEQVMLPETRALDAALAQRDQRKSFRVRSEFEPQSVPFSGYNRGTIVIDTGARFLYLVESSSTARRYAIAVGREGLEFKGSAKVGDKQEWPRWIPTKDMQERDPKKYGQYKDGMPGGPDNPLGARAIYLFQGKSDTHVRIHGTNQPETIGTNSSNGCFRMVNDHVKDLYGRVKIGTEVVVM